jgi:hypothetical protein
MIFIALAYHVTGSAPPLSLFDQEVKVLKAEPCFAKINDQEKSGRAAMLEGAWKLFQRKLYSWLSSKCGLPVCIVGLLLVLISAFQFGEVSE